MDLVGTSGDIGSAFSALQHGEKFLTTIDAVVVMGVTCVGFEVGHGVKHGRGKIAIKVEVNWLVEVPWQAACRVIIIVFFYKRLVKLHVPQPVHFKFFLKENDEQMPILHSLYRFDKCVVAQYRSKTPFSTVYRSIIVIPTFMTFRYSMALSQALTIDIDLMSTVSFVLHF